ncbi:MAG TPA: 2-succinyl-5-enolpyruvyl-6-hydroxy-3-cyclohexene-1-carboxylic-acid synthase [Polyangia bacterium]|nr:2-succinyl-5-enolpyruvyl-6-hydroxy-3-cyclohexene-1-carboxylic-acid synthase [Polyangia bacterium]
MKDTLLDLTAEWAGLLMGSLADAGVTDVVVSPGSRSTPFVLAAVRHSEGQGQGRLRLVDVIDERSAGFYALGRAKATGRPCLLVCTSGSAGAHYLPAVIEAGLSHTPLIVLTADRPLELQECGAPQTIDQLKLFGDHVRGFFELGGPEGDPTALAGLRRAVAQAVARSRHPVPGAVHLNVRARKPLEPRPAASEEERALARRVRAVRGTPIATFHPPRLEPSPEALDDLERACREARRGLIVCGPAPLGQAEARPLLLRLAARTGFPLCVEATSQLRFGVAPFHEDGEAQAALCDGFDALFAVEAFRRQHAADVVLQFGGTPTSGGWERYLAAGGTTRRLVVNPYGWSDPHSSATAMIQAEVTSTVRALLGRLEERGPNQRDERGQAHRARWGERFRAANREAWRVIDELVTAPESLGEAQVARAVVASVPREGVLAVGNSLPIRMVDRYAPARLGTCRVWSQRGANGIDGLVSGAAGVAASGCPTTLLLGDVSLLHDLGGLAVAARATGPLVIVVVQNRGGRIFEQLPLVSTGLPEVAAALPHFTTPHEVSFGAAAALFGIAYHRVETLADLDQALGVAQARQGCSLLEAVVPPHGAAALDAALRERLSGALTTAGLLSPLVPLADDEVAS